MNKKTWIIFIVICVAIFGALIYASRSKKVDVSNIDTATVLSASPQTGNIADHVYGKTDSKVVLVEYGDFQCPACGAAEPVLAQIREEYKDKIAFIFRNNPLASIHPNAKAAAAAAEAAGLQGKYWEMHDKLYKTQTAWSNSNTSQRTDTFIAYAKEIGVSDIEKFKTDMGSSAVNDKISYDLSLGQKAGVSGTPTLTLNKDTLSTDDRQTVESMKKVIDAKLKEFGL